MAIVLSTNTRHRTVASDVPTAVYDSSAALLGMYLHERAGIAAIKRYGANDGQWVEATTIFDMLEELKAKQTKLKNLGLLHRCFDYYCVIRSTSDGGTQADITIPQAARNDTIAVVLDVDPVKHYSVVFVDGLNRCAHVIDTWRSIDQTQANELVKYAFPKLANWLMGRVFTYPEAQVQQGATCGAWVMWLSAAFIVNWDEFRSTVRLNMEKVTRQDPVDFWNLITRRPPRTKRVIKKV